jgi:hypothetical protein
MLETCYFTIWANSYLNSSVFIEPFIAHYSLQIPCYKAYMHHTLFIKGRNMEFIGKLKHDHALMFNHTWKQFNMMQYCVSERAAHRKSEVRIKVSVTCRHLHDSHTIQNTQKQWCPRKVFLSESKVKCWQNSRLNSHGHFCRSYGIESRVSQNSTLQ